MDSDDFFTKEMADFWQQVVAQRTQELYEVRVVIFRPHSERVALGGWRMDGWVALGACF